MAGAVMLSPCGGKLEKAGDKLATVEAVGDLDIVAAECSTPLMFL